VGSNWRDEGGPDAPVRHLIHGSGCRPWFRRVAADADLDGVAFVITSGSLFRVATWNELRGFREDLFLDLVDTEYCLRAGAAGWGVSVAANAHLRHRRGEKRAVRWCGRTWWPAHVPPFRIRLIVRNRVWLLWHYGWIRWPWALFEITHTAFMFFSAICLEDATTPKVHAFVQGLWDGLRGRLGPPRS
jgi:rhamnosyltransferase